MSNVEYSAVEVFFWQGQRNWRRPLARFLPHGVASGGRNPAAGVEPRAACAARGGRVLGCRARRAGSVRAARFAVARARARSARLGAPPPDDVARGRVRVWRGMGGSEGVLVILRRVHFRPRCTQRHRRRNVVVVVVVVVVVAGRRGWRAHGPASTLRFFDVGCRGVPRGEQARGRHLRHHRAAHGRPLVRRPRLTHVRGGVRRVRRAGGRHPERVRSRQARAQRALRRARGFPRAQTPHGRRAPDNRGRDARKRAVRMGRATGALLLEVRRGRGERGVRGRGAGDARRSEPSIQSRESAGR